MFTATLLICSCLCGYGSSDKEATKDYCLSSTELEAAVIRASSLSAHEKGERLAVLIHEGMSVGEVEKVLGEPSFELRHHGGWSRYYLHVNLAIDIIIINDMVVDSVYPIRP